MNNKSKGIAKISDKDKLDLLPSKQMVFARRAAKALMNEVKKNGWVEKIGDKDYLVFEAWQTVGRFYGYTVRTKSTKFAEFDGAKGFEAIMEVVDRNGVVVGGAESLCLNNEHNWKGKPLFAIKSMAQTRAGGKALRQMLGWVAVLAGYVPTPAEDMDGVNIDDTGKTPTLSTKEMTQIKPLLEKVELMKTVKEGKEAYNKFVKWNVGQPKDKKLNGQQMYQVKQALQRKIAILEKSN